MSQDGGFLVMRQDDNGNRFVVGRYAGEEQARAVAAEFEARGHKQMYWVQRPRVVVGAALLRDGRVLAARRSAPEALAGKWEFPGGKVEDDETVAAALERELREELGVDAVAGERLPGAWPVRADLELQIWTATLTPSSAEPTPLQDHDALRWLSLPELHAVDWLPQDTFALPHVSLLLQP